MRFIPTKSVIALAALAASGATFAQASAAPSVTLYGTIEMALEANSDGTTNRTALQNFSSNFGMKGERQVSSDLSGIFQVETGFAPDDTSQSKTLANRNSFVGLKSQSMGTLIIGTNDMPLKELKGTTKIMLGEGEAMETIIHGRGTSQSASASVVPAGGIANTGAFGQVHTRKTNLVEYISPKFSNIVVKFAYSPDEAATVATATAPAYSQAMFGASIEYNDGMWNVGVATQSQDNVIKPTIATAPAVSIPGYALQATKATLGAQMGDWKAGLAFSNIDNGAGKKTNNWMVSGAYTIGPVVLKANYGASSESFGGAADDLTLAGVEVDYSLDKSITLYGQYSQITNSKNAKASYTQSDNFPSASAGKNPTALNFGIQYKF
jgi:predicted porin